MAVPRARLPRARLPRRLPGLDGPPDMSYLRLTGALITCMRASEATERGEARAGRDDTASAGPRPPDGSSGRTPAGAEGGALVTALFPTACVSRHTRIVRCGSTNGGGKRCRCTRS
ncbi:hypothetical protein GCM10022245_39650 [Streptomyces mayteni]